MSTFSIDEIRALPREEALDYVQSLSPKSTEEELFKFHALEFLHNIIGREKDDLSYYSKAMDYAWEGVLLARKKGIYPRLAGLMALNFILDSGHLELDIRDRLPELRLVVLATGEADLCTHRWWDANFWYFANMRILDTAQVCIKQYGRCEGHSAENRRHMEAALSSFTGQGISELARLKSQAAWDLSKNIEKNLLYILRPDFRPIPPPDWRNYKPRGQEWFEFVLERYMDALALSLDVLDQTGDPRLALAVEALRECNEVLDQAALQDGDGYPEDLEEMDSLDETVTE